MPKPTAILFDWDNTLVNSFPIIHEGLNKTFVAMGHEPWTMQEIIQNREGIHHSLRESFPRLFGERWEEAREIYYESFLASHLEKLEMLPDAQALLEALSETDIFTAIVSNKTGKYLREEVVHLGWGDHFDVVVGAQDAEEDKPSVAPVHFALKDSGIAVDENVLFVGDSGTDVECALKAGITPLIFGIHIFEQGHQYDREVDLDDYVQAKDHQELLAHFKDFL